MTLDFTTGLYLVALAQALFFLLLIISGRREIVGAGPLAGVIFIVCYWLFTGLFIQSGLYERWPHAQGWFPAAAWCIGPFMYFYCRSVARGPARAPLRALLHFMPAMLITVLALPNLFISAEEKAAHVAMMASDHEHTPIMIAFLMAVKGQMIVYLVAAWRHLQRAEPVQQQWHQRFVGALIVAEALWVGLFLLHVTAGLWDFMAVARHWALFLSAALLWQVASAVRPRPFMAQAKSAEKYGRAALPASTARDIARELERCLVEDQLFLQTDLTLGALSDHLKLGRHLVSQVINEHLHTSFYRLINRHRVAFAKTLLADPLVGFSIERIAVESGFNNRVTFNKAFKELEGTSPSEYRRSAKLRPAIA